MADFARRAYVLTCFILKKKEILTAGKDSVIDLGGLPQSHTLLHHGRNSILLPVFRGNENNSAVYSRNQSYFTCNLIFGYLELFGNMHQYRQNGVQIHSSNEIDIDIFFYFIKTYW